MNELSDPYLGILISSDGMVCRIGLDGFPIDYPPEPPEPDEQQTHGCEPLLAVYDETFRDRARDATRDRDEHD
ncbi:hypothetical protein [Nocardia paucivorans]|uniref:hypothetical protein n=1 Tax=Nocardia paucivorans TaxID=114259 RepID=UPI0003056042|nr:hypothetical protein [Nocardia paucivorans]